MELKDLDELVQKKTRAKMRDDYDRMRSGIATLVGQFVGSSSCYLEGATAQTVFKSFAKPWETQLDDFDELYQRRLKNARDKILTDFEHFAQFVRTTQKEVERLEHPEE